MRGNRREVKRNFIDYFADRVRQAMTAEGLISAMERVAEMVDVATGSIDSDLAARMISCGTAPDAKRVQNWLREHSRLVAVLCRVQDGPEFVEALQGIDIDGEDIDGVVAERKGFDLSIMATCLAPLAHGADIKAGNATLFRRMDVMATNGAVLSLPFYAGNAFRGQMRDLLADHFLSSLGIVPRRDTLPLVTWFWQILYSGGALEEKNSRAAKQISQLLGSGAALKAKGVHRFRDTLPAISLLGCSVGNKILAGRIQVGDLRPRCRQWGTGEHDAGQLMEWQYLTRREDREEHEEHSGMIAQTECMQTGTVLDGGIDVDAHATDLERAALATGLWLMAENAYLGAESRRGFGKMTLEYRDAPKKDLYEAHLNDHKPEIMALLEELGAWTGTE